MVDYKLSLMWGFPFFIVFDLVAYGQLQTLASVGLSIFYRFYSRRMIHYRLLASVGLAQACPNNSMFALFLQELDLLQYDFLQNHYCES